MQHRVVALGLPDIGAVFTGLGILVMVGLGAAAVFAIVVRMQESRATRPGRLPRQSGSGVDDETAREARRRAERALKDRDAAERAADQRRRSSEQRRWQ